MEMAAVFLTQNFIIWLLIGAMRWTFMIEKKHYTIMLLAFPDVI